MAGLPRFTRNDVYVSSSRATEGRGDRVKYARNDFCLMSLDCRVAFAPRNDDGLAMDCFDYAARDDAAHTVNDKK